MKSSHSQFFFFLMSTINAGSLQAGTVGATVENNEWSGFYAGLNVGVGWSSLNNALSVVNNPSHPLFITESIPGINASGTSSLNASQASGGVQLGYDKMLQNNFVAGLLLSYDYLGLIKSSGGQFTYTSSNNQYSLVNSATINQMGTLRARAGYRYQQMLPYITAGGALSSFKFRQNFTDFNFAMGETAQINQALWGWVVGGGLEYAAFAHCTLKVEYLYAGFGNQNLKAPFNGTGVLSGQTASLTNVLTNHNLQTLLFGFNYYFA